MIASLRPFHELSLVHVVPRSGATIESRSQGMSRGSGEWFPGRARASSSRYRGAMHPFRFGVMSSRAASAELWLASARRAEELGYDILLIPDHLGSQLSPIAALAAAATATARLRIGSYVFANDYRHPLVLAREAASLDLLSGGRFELGLGAGWNVADYRRLGLPYDPPPRRIDRLAEALPLVKRLLAGEVVDHEGPHYRLGGASVGVVPVQRPRPPILIGGGGPRMLRLAAREADIVAFQPQFDPRGRPMVRQATEGATARKITILREAAGERFEQLELNVIVGDAGLVGSGRPAGESLLAAAKAAATALIGTPYALYGTLGHLRDQLQRRRDRLGISYYAIPGHAMEAMAPLVATLAGR
jgi:probable F420-dependent oxidoreductase